MNNITEKMISIEEAETALRCMRLSGLDEIEALETLDEFAFRIRKLTTAHIVENIINNDLPRCQADIVRKYWFEGENTAQIGRDLGVSQANVYRTLSRADETIKKRMTALIEYQNDLEDVSLVPIHTKESLEILSSQKRESKSFAESLKNLRKAYAITQESMAAKLKISTRELDDIECGRKIPSAITASRYTALFNVEIKMDFTHGGGQYLCKQL